jgi:Putative metallopeptidase
MPITSSVVLKHLLACLLGCLCLIYGQSAAAGEVKIDWSAISLAESERIRAVLNEGQVEQRLAEFSEKSFVLKKEIVIAVYHGAELFLDVSSGVTYLPLQMLRQLEASIEGRYARQLVRHKIFSAAVEQLLWVQLGKALVSQFSLPIQGEPSYALDGFATVMLLNLYDSPYLLDATEEYLLVDLSDDALVSGRFQSELEFDKSRYQLIVCTVVGKDFDRFQNNFPELAWTSDRRAQCEQRYQTQILEWYQALLPYLKPSNRIRYWLPESLVEPLDQQLK